MGSSKNEVVPAEPRGVQIPQIVHLPPGVVSLDAAVECIELADSVGLYLDESQQYTINVGCGERADGRWAAYEMGDCESRQNGKGDTKIARALAGLYLWDEPLMIWTAHEFRTANESFLRIVSLIENNDDLRRQVLRIRYGNGEQAVEMLSGQRLKFAARTGGSGRGFADVSTLFYDEAQHLAGESVAASSGGSAVAENPQIWFAGSAGLRSSAHWWRMRRRALLGNGGLMRHPEGEPGTAGPFGYVEHTAEVVSIDDKGALRSVAPDPESLEARCTANPALGRKPRGIEAEWLDKQYALLGPELFSREHLTVWDPEPATEISHEPKINPEKWAATLRNLRPRVMPGAVTLAFAVCDRTRRASISVAAGSLGAPYSEVIEDRDGFGWLPKRLAELTKKWKPRKVGVDGGGPEASLIPLVLIEFEKQGLSIDLVHQFSTADLKAACGAWYTAIEEGRMSRASFRAADGERRGQSAIDDSVADAGERVMQNGWIFDRRTVKVSIAPLLSSVEAVFLLPESGSAPPATASSAPTPGPTSDRDLFRPSSRLNI